MPTFATLVIVPCPCSWMPFVAFATVLSNEFHTVCCEYETQLPYASRRIAYTYLKVSLALMVMLSTGMAAFGLRLMSLFASITSCVTGPGRMVRPMVSA